MHLSHADVRRILDILDNSEHLESLDVTIGEFKLHARKTAGPSPAIEQTMTATTAESLESAPEAPVPIAPTGVPMGLVEVRSSMVGTFYLHPSPDQPPFVTVGSTVQEGDTLCMVEVMKLYNTIKAEVSGTIESILIETGKPVQHDQILILIRPNEEAGA